MISAGTKGEEHAEQLAERLNEMARNDMPVPAQVVPVTMDDIDAAHENGMTAGQKWMQENILPETGSESSDGSGAQDPQNGGAKNRGQNVAHTPAS